MTGGSMTQHKFAALRGCHWGEAMPKAPISCIVLGVAIISSGLIQQARATPAYTLDNIVGNPLSNPISFTLGSLFSLSVQTAQVPEPSTLGLIGLGLLGLGAMKRRRRHS